MSLDEFATAIGTSQATLSRFETGQRNVSPQTLDRIATLVGERLALAETP